MRWTVLLVVPAALATTLFLPGGDRGELLRTLIGQWCRQACDGAAWNVAGILRHPPTGSPDPRIQAVLEGCEHVHPLRWRLAGDVVVVECAGPDGVFDTGDDGRGDHRVRPLARVR